MTTPTTVPVDDADSTRVATLLENTIRDIGIPPRPTILVNINAEMAKDEPDFKRLAHIIGSDVSLTAGLISLANSPFFGGRSRVRSANEALFMLGLNVASRAIAGLVLRKVLPPTPDIEHFWDFSSKIARLSGWLAQRSRGVKIRVDDAYTFGLFRDCGIPLLLRRFPNYTNVLKNADQATGSGFTALEDAEYPTNHAKVGCLLAQGWWLPEEICLAIHHHHNDPALLQDSAIRLPVATQGLIAIAHLAEHLLQFHTNQSLAQEGLTGDEALLQILGISADDLPDIYEECKAVIISSE